MEPLPFTPESFHPLPTVEALPSNKILVTLSPIYKSLTYASGSALTGLFFQLFFAPLSPLFYALGAAMAVTKLVINALQGYSIKVIEKTCILINKYPRLQLISFIFSTLISGVSRVLSAASGVGLGILSGLMIEVDLIKRWQNILS